MKAEILGENHPDVVDEDDIPDGTPKPEPVDPTEEEAPESDDSGEDTPDQWDSEQPKEGESVGVVTYDQMIEAMGKWLSDSKSSVSWLHLSIQKQRTGYHIIYQGSPNAKWASLFDSGTYFYRNSLLRALLALDNAVEEHEKVLYHFFKDFSIITGRKKF